MDQNSWKVHTLADDDGVLEKVYTFQDANNVRKAGVYPYFRPIQSSADADVHIDGEKKIMVGSNNYLGLTTHPEVTQAAKDAIDKYGSGCTGSRFLNGTLDIHLLLEAELSDFFKREDTLVLTTGYQTNLSAVSCLAGRRDLIFSDEENHASLIDACRLSFGRMVKYKHNNMADLERLLIRYKNTPGKLIVTDGVFSMSGDIVDLPSLCDLAERYNAAIVLDDAHGIGVLGPHGEGTAYHFGCQDRVDIITGTFSKSFATVGGYISANQKIIDFIRHKARPYMFSASLPPASVATARTCLHILRNDPERLKKLWDNLNYIAKQFKQSGVPILNYSTPIVPIQIGSDLLTFQFNKVLFESGIFANPVVSPAVPPGKGVIRTSYMATHTLEELDTIADVILQLFKKFDLPLIQS